MTAPTDHAEALYVVVDGSLPTGDKMAQAGHAIAAWCIKNPELAARWSSVSEYLIILETPYRNEGDALYNLYRTARPMHDLDCTGYFEPDLDDDLTAVAFNPDARVASLLANLPLAGRPERRMEIIKEIFRTHLPTEDFYEDEETGVIDLEWRSEHGRAHLQLGETRYAMYVTDRLDLSDKAGRSEHFNGRIRDLPKAWDTIGATLDEILYQVGMTSKAGA